MGDHLKAFVEWVEMETFFSGYIFIFAIAHLAAPFIEKRFPRINITDLLPLSYALIGTLYAGLQLRNWYYAQHYFSFIQTPWFIIWGLSSMFFWLDILRKKSYYSALHNIPFFVFFLVNLFDNKIDPSAGYSNTIKVFTASIIINFIALLLVIISAYFKKRSS